MGKSIDNRGPVLVGVNIAFMAAAVVANMLRCYVRIRMVKGFGIDDYLMTISTIAFITYCSFSIAGTHYGTGRHHADLEWQNIVSGANRWWYCYLFYCVVMITSKLSIGYFLLRITIKKVHTWIIHLSMFISVFAGVIFFFVTVFQCNPVSYYWDKWSPGAKGTCINVEVIIGLGYLYSAFSIISDFTFALLPAFIIWNLQLDKRTKMALVPLLTMGCIASSGAVARIPYMISLRDPDFLWSTTDVAIWSTVEMGLAITAGSLATLRPLFTLILATLGFSTGKGSRLTSSKFGAPSPGSSQMFGNKKKPSKQELNGYGMNTFNETIVERGNTYTPPGVKGDSESQKSLKGSDRDSLPDRDLEDMRIMVNKTFFVSESDQDLRC